MWTYLRFKEITDFKTKKHTVSGMAPRVGGRIAIFDFWASFGVEHPILKRFPCSKKYVEATGQHFFDNTSIGWIRKTIPPAAGPRHGMHVAVFFFFKDYEQSYSWYKYSKVGSVLVCQRILTVDAPLERAGSLL